MIIGRVNSDLEATVTVRLVGPTGQSQEITAVIDTGFNGTITLPQAVVSALSLPQAASREVTLGDASRKVFAYYNASLAWGSETLRVRALCVEGDPLIGTALLKGFKLDADFVVNGAVVLTVIS